MAYSKKHNILASSSYDKTVRLWKEYNSEWKILKTCYGHEGKTWGLLFLDNMNRLASGGNDKKIKIWNVFSGECE